MYGVVSVSRCVRVLVVGIAVMVLGGCSQMIKHSNTMVFGTNTTIGLKVGRDAGQVPTVQIGYDRQEVAIVPLLANTEAGDRGELKPCPKEFVNKCHFRATYGGVDKDAYSTVASFGAQSAAGGDDGEANMNVAQYFATGIAAQRLAVSGGANIVAAGPGSEKIAEAAKAAADARKAEQEAIKVRSMSRLEAGIIAARAILFDDEGKVVKEKREQLVRSMGDSKCTDGDFEKFNGADIEDFIGFLKQRRSFCMRALARKNESSGD